jgi:FKBP-type peptidyl-prolyl cis-trans isomerase (trigger factor)
MQTNIHRLEDGTIELIILIPWSDIETTYQEAIDILVKQVEVKGFRKGKAPKKLAQEKLEKDTIYQEVIRMIIPKAYTEAIQNHKVTPIIQPDITLTKAKENEDWEIKALTCEKPKIDVSPYKKIIKETKGELKKDDLWLPGKENKEQKQENTEEKRQKTLNLILSSLLSKIICTIPAILVKTDVEKRLTALIDDVRGLGLTIDTYCKSKSTTPEALRSQYEMEAKQAYKLEFILEDIADFEKIVVSDTEIDAMIAKTKDEKEKNELTKNRYMLAHLLRRQKTLDTLLSL